MFRIIAIAAVVVAFGAALYYSGDYLETWESPQPAAKAAPAPASKKKASRAQRARKARKQTRREPAWLVQLNTLCRRGQAESETIRPPSGPRDTARYIRQLERMNRRLNRQGAELVQASGNARVTGKLRRLFAQDEALIHTMLTASEQGEYERLGKLVRSLLAVAKSENRLLGRLGAVDCTVSPSDFELY